MNIIRRWFNDYFAPINPMAAGIYQYHGLSEDGKPYRLHLRMEQDGNGLLIVNAKTVLHLNQTGAEFAYHLIKGTSQDEMVKDISKRYRVSKEEVIRDFQELSGKLSLIGASEDVDPETFFGMDRRDPYSIELSAPLRLDCALTYRTGEEGTGKLTPVDRVKRELLTEEWKLILDKAWKAGIPHVIFTGGEPSLRSDLVDLVRYAEQLGMVSGLLSDGLRLVEPKYLEEVLQAGLDHVMLLLDSQDEQSWHALRDTLAADIFVTVHLTINRKNAGKTDDLITRLDKMGVKSISLSADAPELGTELKAAQQSAANHGLSLTWDLPVPYSKYHPISLELAGEPASIEGAGRAWLYVEPDGDVLPGQGVEGVLGNLLTDAWEIIRGKLG